MNNLYVFYKMYWIVKNTGKKGEPIIAKGFMRQTAAPWLTGNGLQIRFGKYTFQVGICGKPKNLDDQSGLLYAMQGRLMDSDPDEIGNW